MTRNELTKCFSNTPTLHTARLTLRRMLPSDSADMYEYAKLPAVTEFLLWSPHRSEEQSRDYLQALQTSYKRGEFFDWAVVITDTGKMIGTCGYTDIDLENRRAEIGYVLNPSYWGNGYAPEAVMAAQQFAFENLGINRIEAHYIIGNDRSLRVMKKCGMREEAKLSQYMNIKGKYCDIGICAVTKDKFASAKYCTVEKKKRLFFR